MPRRWREFESFSMAQCRAWCTIGSMKRNALIGMAMVLMAGGGL